MKNRVTLSEDGEAAYVELTQGQTAIIDAEDVASIERYRWYAMRKEGSNRYYAATNAPLDGKKFKVVYLGRFIGAAGSDERIVYQNGNPLDSRRGNLKKVEKGTGCQVVDF